MNYTVAIILSTLLHNQSPESINNKVYQINEVNVNMVHVLGDKGQVKILSDGKFLIDTESINADYKDGSPIDMSILDALAAAPYTTSWETP